MLGASDDWLQAVVSAVWPKLSPVLRGIWQVYRGIRVETLGAAMAANLETEGRGLEVLHGSEMTALALRVAETR
jgi:hypothetical protein